MVPLTKGQYPDNRVVSLTTGADPDSRVVLLKTHLNIKNRLTLAPNDRLQLPNRVQPLYIISKPLLQQTLLVLLLIFFNLYKHEHFAMYHPSGHPAFLPLVTNC